MAERKEIPENTLDNDLANVSCVIDKIEQLVEWLKDYKRLLEVEKKRRENRCQ